MGKTDEENVEEIMRRVEANDVESMYVLGIHYQAGYGGLQQNEERAMELWIQAAKLGSSKAHLNLGNVYGEGGDLKKAKIHYEAAAIAGHEGARYNLGCNETQSGNMERALKHWTIAATAGHQKAMNALLLAFNQSIVSRDEIDPILTSYNNSCAEMRSEARDAFIQWHTDHAAER
jgi:TPR repeat protein